MKARPADRNDAAIRAHLEAGLSCGQIAPLVGVAMSWVRKRAVHLGLKALADANGQANLQRRWAIGGVGRPKGVFHDRMSATCPSGVDPAPSDLVRRLRTVSAPTFHDPDNALAALHRRGLTLDDFEVCFGISPSEAVAAIRRSA